MFKYVSSSLTHIVTSALERWYIFKTGTRIAIPEILLNTRNFHFVGLATQGITSQTFYRDIDVSVCTCTNSRALQMNVHEI
jgi:hypothetical protein